jgi:hypothetical protein
MVVGGWTAALGHWGEMGIVPKRWCPQGWPNRSWCRVGLSNHPTPAQGAQQGCCVGGGGFGEVEEGAPVLTDCVEQNTAAATNDSSINSSSPVVSLASCAISPQPKATPQDPPPPQFSAPSPEPFSRNPFGPAPSTDLCLRARPFPLGSNCSALRRSSRGQQRQQAAACRMQAGRAAPPVEQAAAHASSHTAQQARTVRVPATASRNQIANPCTNATMNASRS